MEYLKRIDESKDEMVRTLQELVSIKSVEDKPAKDAPFGKGVAEAFDYMMKKAESEGFDTENADNYGGHIEFGGYILDEEGQITGTSDEVMGIIGHLDVVPEGSDWEYEPYGGVIADGRIYGRGTIDNKGPVVAAYYAMKALRDSGYMPEKKVRLILGLDEETNWKGMYHYLSKVKAPDFGFTPDAEYPAIYAEKGILVFQLAKKIGKSAGKGLELRSLTGGNAPNSVADYARAVVRADKMEAYDKVKELASQYRDQNCAEEGQHAYGAKLNCKGVGKSLEIVVQGVSAHGATPEDGTNAVSVLMDFLGKIDIINDDVNEFVEFYNKHIGFELDGSAMGCGLSDEASGKLVFNVGKVDLEGEALILTINIRYPVTFNDDTVYQAMMPVINKYNMGVIKIKNQDPIYMPKDHPMIKTLMEIYGEHTGDTEREPILIGGELMPELQRIS
ncbi:Sapep family Mn(2+)-dependent dipeptidase [Aminipila terrae]|uniref:Sapep family Mn(2+)-dependent dipeptidase n=1 Tax=Aminipila terrae TaxID=2697030 RepID=A0A6P1MF48_9FIRM|nr:Sapep family Mn(2+)-dependent dipeptidase [Aminipila terrae]QHI72652.1 Sapep family Mn(2+)-dependent dipeptidase [Aminipila terrae]